MPAVTSFPSAFSTLRLLNHGLSMYCTQVLFVLQDGHPKGGVIGESGSMNVFFLIREEDSQELELVTPPLDGLVLPGVTRDTVLQLARSFGDLKVSERPLRFGEVNLYCVDVNLHLSRLL